MRRNSSALLLMYLGDGPLIRRDTERPGQAGIKISAEADAESDPVTQFEHCTSF